MPTMVFNPISVPRLQTVRKMRSEQKQKFYKQVWRNVIQYHDVNHKSTVRISINVGSRNDDFLRKKLGVRN